MISLTCLNISTVFNKSPKFKEQHETDRRVLMEGLVLVKLHENLINDCQNVDNMFLAHQWVLNV